MSDGGSSPLSLKKILIPEAERDVRLAIRYLEQFGEEVAIRFVSKLAATLDALTERIADELASGNGLFDHPDEGASLQYSRPVFQERFQTGKTRARRSSAGVWRIFYGLDDDDKDGKTDTLRVYAIRHAAARPFPDFEGEDL